jgi:hypothetical protein
MVNSEELIGTTEYLTLYTGFRLNRCHYNRVRLYLVKVNIFWKYDMRRSSLQNLFFRSEGNK